MPFINIHTHHSPDGEGILFIKNLLPSDQTEPLKPGGFYSVGLHPWFITNNHDNKEQLAALEQKISLPEVVAVGECGLDKLANTESQLQLAVFISQCEMAEAVNKPVILHCVKSYNEISHLRRRMKPTVPWILHGYTGNEMVTSQLLSLGFYFSFGKMLLNSGADWDQILGKIPPDRLFFETDEWQHPVEEIYLRYAENQRIPKEKLTEQIMWNFRQVFVRQ